MKSQDIWWWVVFVAICLDAFMLFLPLSFESQVFLGVMVIVKYLWCLQKATTPKHD